MVALAGRLDKPGLGELTVGGEQRLAGHRSQATLAGDLARLGGVELGAALQLGRDRLDQDGGAHGGDRVVGADQQGGRRIAAELLQHGQQASQAIEVATLLSGEHGLADIESLQLVALADRRQGHHTRPQAGENADHEGGA